MLTQPRMLYGPSVPFFAGLCAAYATCFSPIKIENTRHQGFTSWLQEKDTDAAVRGLQEQEAHYLYLGDYERQVASTIKCRLKGDGRVYGMYLKTDSYFEGVGMNELWQAHIRTRYVAK